MNAQIDPNTAFFTKCDESERAVLSALYVSLLESGSAITNAKLTEDAFMGPERRTLFRVLMQLWAEAKPGQSADACEVIHRMRAYDQEMNPSVIIANLESFATGQGIEYYIERLMECRAARALWHLGKVLTQKAYNVAEDTSELLQSAILAISAISTHTEVEKTSFRHHLSAVVESLENISAPSNALDFGLGLDETAGPFCRSDLVIIAGETGRGKSAIAGNIVENVASKGFKVAVFSLEMSGHQVAERMLASQACIDMRTLKLKRRRMAGQPTNGEDMDMVVLVRALARIVDWPIEIIEQSSSLMQVIGSARKMKAVNGLDLIVVDHAQLVHGYRQNSDNREAEVASISRGLKRLAQELNVIVLLLAQVNDEGRLRESRALGHDANTVLFLDCDGEKRTLRVGKARSAPSGVEIPLMWRPTFTRFDKLK